MRCSSDGLSNSADIARDYPAPSLRGALAPTAAPSCVIALLCPPCPPPTCCTYTVFAPPAIDQSPPGGRACAPAPPAGGMAVCRSCPPSPRSRHARWSTSGCRLAQRPDGGDRLFAGRVLRQLRGAAQALQKCLAQPLGGTRPDPGQLHGPPAPVACARGSHLLSSRIHRRAARPERARPSPQPGQSWASSAPATRY